MKESKERYRLFIVYMFSPGFVGLVVPHVTRLYLGSNYRHLLPLSFLNGGAFLVLADLIARTVITPCELPIGVITALPAFAVLFIRKYRS